MENNLKFNKNAVKAKISKDIFHILDHEDDIKASLFRLRNDDCFELKNYDIVSLNYNLPILQSKEIESSLQNLFIVQEYVLLKVFFLLYGNTDGIGSSKNLKARILEIFKVFHEADGYFGLICAFKKLSLFKKLNDDVENELAKYIK